MNAESAAVRQASPLEHRWGLRLLLGLVQIIGGLVAIAIPVAGSLAAVAVFGAVLLVIGAMQLYQVLSTRPVRTALLPALGGVFYVIAALLVLLFPLEGALTLTIVVATLLVADGVVRCMLGYQIARGEGRGWVLAAGIASTAVGVLLLIGWPGTGVWALGVLFGASLLFSGISNGVLAFVLRRQSAQSGTAHALGTHHHA